MGKPEFPAKFRFLPIKNPCNSVSFYTNKKSNEVFLEWHPGDSTSEIKGQELRKFKSDTKELLDLYLSVYVLAFSNKKSLIEKSNTMDALTCSYWKNWGPLIPSRTNSLQLPQTHSLPINELLNIGFWYYIVLIFWNEVSDLEFLPTQKLFDEIRLQHSIEIRDRSYKLAGPRYWYPFFDFTEDKQLTWILLSRKRLPLSEFTLLIKHPTKEEFEGLEIGIGNPIDWMKKNILQNVANYISRQKLSFAASVEGHEMHLTGSTDNLFLAHLMNEVIVVGQRHVKLCECGCGNPVPPGSRKYYDPKKCKERGVRRKITNWLGTRKSKTRKQLSDKEYEELIDEVDKLIEDGKSEQEIRKIIEPKADKFKAIKPNADKFKESEK